jgi:hypothetical protein
MAFDLSKLDLLVQRVDAQAQACMRLPEGDLPVFAGDGTSKSDQHQVVADVQPVDLDEHQVHGPAASQSSACAAVQVGSVTSWPS